MMSCAVVVPLRVVTVLRSVTLDVETRHVQEEEEDASADTLWLSRPHQTRLEPRVTN